MNRRDFIVKSAAAAVVGAPAIKAKSVDAARSNPSAVDESFEGKPANLARYGEFQSWINPGATPAIQREFSRGQSGAAPLRVAALAGDGFDADIGVEWPEFRTVNKVAVRFPSKEKAPSRGDLYLEMWTGTTALQGEWKEVDFLAWDLPFQGLASEVSGATWVFPFSDRRTCKIRLRFQGAKHVELDAMEVYGPSTWRAGEVRIEWGHAASKRRFDGHLEIYNGEILTVRPLGATELQGPTDWLSTVPENEVGGISVKLLGTSGEVIDRTVLTLRTHSGDLSFLPAEALDGEPIDIPDFGVYVTRNKAAVGRAEYRRRNAAKSRIVDAVAKLPEQTMAGAYGHIHADRVLLSFVGVDCNNHKFGIAPDGHVVIGNNDPSYGRPMVTNFAVYCASTAASAQFAEPTAEPDQIFKEGEEHHQEPEDGWLPVLKTSWTRNGVGFERTDFAALAGSGQPSDPSNLMGNELALLVSRLSLHNASPLPQTVSYYLKPWKPQTGNPDFGGIPAKAGSAWEVTLDQNFVTVLEGGQPYSLAYVDSQGAGKLSLEPQLGAVRYALTLDPGGTHTIDLITSGELLPLDQRNQLTEVQYGALHEAAVKYWRDRAAEGMQIEIPDSHLQNIYNASLHHFFLAMTKDGKREETYPNAAVFAYGPIGSESSPILRSLEMRGLHQRAEECLKCWLSTQGSSMPDGDYSSKQGGFYQFFTLYTVNQGGVLWSLAEHYLYTRDASWLRQVAPQIVAACDFIIRERKRTQRTLPSGRKPIWQGLAPAGSIFDMRDWEYTFMLNGWFYVGLKKSAQILMDVDAGNARRIAAEAEDYRQSIRAALKESIALAPVTRLRDNTSVPALPPFPGLRGFRTELKDIPKVGYGQGYIYDVEGGPLHLLQTEVLEHGDAETAWMLAYLEDRFFTYAPGPCRVRLDELSTDWFNLGGFAKLQPYYLHYQDAYLQRDEIPNFLRGFFNTLATTSDPQTLTFQEAVSADGGQPNKTHEEGWFFLQLRSMLVMEAGENLFLARGTPREWLEDGKTISVQRAPSYFGELGYRIESHADHGRIEATVFPPIRARPANIFLRLRHPKNTTLRRVTIGNHPWTEFDAGKEWVKLPLQPGELKLVAYYDG